ncbi:MAG: zf-HC2 domain-containing protein [Acidimicrobiales bacterium]
MTDASWHVPPPALARFADDAGSIDAVTASSIEAHLVACDACRRALAAATAPAGIATSWDAVADRVDVPASSAAERLLGRLGFGGGVARLVAATPALRAAGLAAVAALAAAAAGASRIADTEGPFLVLAPLVPLVAVAATFAPTTDPAGEAGVATSLHGAGLLVRRAAAVLGASFFVLGLAAVALPDLGPVAAAWVLPALALVIAALALGTYVRVEPAVAALASSWVVAVLSVRWLEGRDVAYPDSAPFTASGQLVALGIALAAGAVAVARRDRFATLEVFR